MTIELTRFDTPKHMTDLEDQAEFLADAIATGDARIIAKAIGLVARAYGMSELSSQTGIHRQTLYRAFSDNGNPTLETLLTVLPALGLELSINATQQSALCLAPVGKQRHQMEYAGPIGTKAKVDTDLAPLPDH